MKKVKPITIKIKQIERVSEGAAWWLERIYGKEINIASLADLRALHKHVKLYKISEAIGTDEQRLDYSRKARQYSVARGNLTPYEGGIEVYSAMTFYAFAKVYLIDGSVKNA